VVSGFGLASVYTAPLSKWLIGRYGIQVMMLVLGIAFFVLITGVKPLVMLAWGGLAAMLQPPPKDYVPVKPTSLKESIVHDKDNLTPGEMLRTPQFYLIWFMYACGAGAGLMVIAKLAAIADKQAGIHLGFMLVAILAIGNGAGRIVAGMLSDKIGRKATLFLCFVVQAFSILLLSFAREGNILANVTVLSLLSALIGANYGANLALFPSLTKDFYGLKNFGVNYGLVFTSWGVGGFMLAYLAGKMYDIHQTFAFAYYGACGLLVLAAIAVLTLKPPRRV
jgi:OFA family oxalate/formate antiporter-like MFS transporter